MAIVPTAKEVGDWEAMALSIMRDLARSTLKWVRDQGLLRNRVTGKGWLEDLTARLFQASRGEGDQSSTSLAIGPRNRSGSVKELENQGIPFAWTEADALHVAERYESRVNVLIESLGEGISAHAALESATTFRRSSAFIAPNKGRLGQGDH